MTTEKKLENPAAWVEGIVKDFIDNSPENTLQKWDNEKAWDRALVGFSSGADPIFEDYKDHVGPFYMTPWEVFVLTFKDPTVKPEELTVISWVLPHREAVKADNRLETVYPAERWARARIMGQEVIEKLQRHVVATLDAEGIKAVAPCLTPQFSHRISPKYGFAGTWSERHAAYASGLGTFGLCDAMITPVGKAMRTASVVARIQIPPTPRPYKHHREYCLFYTEGTCGVCMDRCPVRAISEKGKDKWTCINHLYPTTSDYVTYNFGFKGYGCGLCQTGVPCESKIPTNEDLG
jgi:epoxyqueuosine reductase QueG